MFLSLLRKFIFQKYGRAAVIVILQLPVQSVSITSKVVSSNPIHGVVYSLQRYVIKFVSDLRQVGGFLRILRLHPPIKLTATTKLKY
jgi:hypothetical protein